MKRILVLMLVAVAMFAFVSCENKSAEPDEAIKDLDYSKLIGSWKMSDKNDSKNYISIKFKEGKTADVEDNTASAGGGFDNMTITISGNTVTFAPNYTSDSRYSYKVEIGEKELKLTQVGDKNMFSYHSDLKTITLSKMV